MKKFLLIVSVFVSLTIPTLPGVAQISELVSLWDGFGGSYADVWAEGDYAYVAHFGHAGVSIVDISDPANPTGTEYAIPSPNDSASAQDVKVWNGLLFVGLSGNADGSVHIVDVRNPLHPVEVVNVVISGMTSIHNVFVDDGFLYMTDSGSPRIAVVDVRNLDPDNPPASPITDVLWMIEDIGTSFVHDMTVQGGRLYACGWDSGLWIYDVTNVATAIPSFLGQTPDGGNNTHACWPTDNGDYVVTGEERTGGGIKVYRITENKDSSLTLVLTDSLAFSNSTHNQVIIGYRLYVSWYENGLQVFDIDPATGLLQFVTSFQTPNAWGIYPFRGINEILISDINNGLYVIDTDAPPPELQFNYPNGRPDLIDPDGGIAFQVELVGLGGSPLPATGILFVDRGHGFESFPMTQIVDNLYEANFPPTHCGTEVRYYFSAEAINGETEFDPAPAPSQFYTALSGYSIEVGFSDDFESDLGWTVSGDATAGLWERGIPVGGGTRGDPEFDGDGSGSCYLTENAAGNSDVDGGSTTLTSPIMDATTPVGYEAVISYYRWYSNHAGGAPEADILVVEISNDGGSTWTDLEVVGPGGPETQGGWYRRSFRIRDVVANTHQMRIRITASDLGAGSVVEAGIDGVQIEHVNCLATVVPEGQKLLDGVVFAGQISDLFQSDDQYLELDPSPTKNPVKQKIQIVLQSTSPSDTPSALKFRLESRMIGGPSGDVTQALKLFNVDTNKFELVDIRPAANADEIVEVTLAGNLTRFIHPLTSEVTATIVWTSDSFAGKPFTWSVDLDEAVWLIAK